MRAIRALAGAEPMWKLATLLLTGPLIYVLFGFGEREGVYTVAERKLCPPIHWVVFSDRDLPKQGDPNLDVSAPGGFVYVDVPVDVVLRQVPGFTERVVSTSSVSGYGVEWRNHLSAMITPAIDFRVFRHNLEHDRSAFPELEPEFDPEVALWRLTTGRSEYHWNWYYFPNADILAPLEQWEHWGSCSSRDNLGPGAYECRRHLSHDGLSIKYNILSVNMSHREALDRLLIEFIDAWRCD